MGMTQSKRIHLTLIIPAYNETTRLIGGLSAVLSYLTKQSYRWEILVIDDGSKLPVSKLLSHQRIKKTLPFFINKLPVFVYRLPRNKGKGGAIAEGVSRARGNYIVFTDADQSVPIASLKRALILLRTHDMVIASRRAPGSTIAVHQSWGRETAGRLFTALSNILCATNVADVTCGFKGFSRDTARRLFARSRISRWVFDTEIVFLARKYSVNLVEMPVVWSNKAGSKVRFEDNIRSLVDLMNIRWHEMKCDYEMRAVRG